MITDHDPSLESILAIVVGTLQQQRHERLDLQDLRRLLHEDVVVAEVEAHQVGALESRVRARHGHDLGLARHKILGSVGAVPNELERPELLQLLEETPQVAKAALGGVPVAGEARPAEHGLPGRRGEEARERKLLRHRVHWRRAVQPGHVGLPHGPNEIQIEVNGCLARVGRRVAGGGVRPPLRVQALLQPVDLVEELEALGQRVVDAAVAAEVLQGV